MDLGSLNKCRALRTTVLWLALCLLPALAGCNSFFTRFIAKSFENLPSTPDTVESKVEHPILAKTGFAVLWVGHATCLIQIGDKVFLTDPIFTSTAGMISKRSIEPGIRPAAIDRLDFILISHIHFDHLSYASLEMLPKSATLVFPEGSATYIPELGFSNYCELKPWTRFEAGEVSITAVPAVHFGGRYGFDAGWTAAKPYTGYIVGCGGATFYFAGDTGYDPELFKEIGKRFAIDVAFIPIAPVEPRSFMRRVHADPKDALQIFDDLGAKMMIPIHHHTFIQGLDPGLDYAREQLRQLIRERHLEDRVFILKIGEQRIFPSLPRTPSF
jgi:N-acyl-phosphatidylethanolamine-hydrolysing phospholipase D